MHQQNLILHKFNSKPDHKNKQTWESVQTKYAYPANCFRLINILNHGSYYIFRRKRRGVGGARKWREGWREREAGTRQKYAKLMPILNKHGNILN
jgi:hypothetical protein